MPSNFFYTGDTRPGQTSKKTKDLSACEGNQCGCGESLLVLLPVQPRLGVEIIVMSGSGKLETKFFINRSREN